MSTLIQTDRFALSETERSAIEHEMHHYEDPRAASIEALKIVQKERGWVPDGAADAIGEILGIPASDVEGGAATGGAPVAALSRFWRSATLRSRSTASARARSASARIAFSSD